VSASQNQTAISSSGDAPITDLWGNAWRISPSGFPTANGVADTDGKAVLQLVYSNQMTWRQTQDLRWWSKRHPGDQWWPPGGTPISPISGSAGRELQEIDRAVSEVLINLAALKSDLDDFKSLPVPGITPVITAINILQSDVDARYNTLAAQIAAGQTTLLSTIRGMFATADTASATRDTALLASISALFQINANAVDANQKAVIALLNQLIAALGEPNKPTRLDLDTSHATHTMQAIPSASGP
jgi:hypothetical protein